MNYENQLHIYFYPLCPGRLGAIEDELQAAERALDASSGVSLDKEKLTEQLEAQRIVNAGLGTCRAQLERYCRVAIAVSGL